MKIFFTSSQRGKQFFLANYKRIQATLKNIPDVKLIEDDLLNEETEKFYEKLKLGGQKAYIDFYQQELNHLKTADINIFDCSFHSLSIGFTIQRSIDINKPTIVLYEESKTPYFLTGIEEEKFIISSYNKTNLETIVNKALKLAMDVRDKRFNFFIRPDLLNYITEVSKKDDIPISVFLRNLILEHKKKNK
ncbi:MAG: hypothetical protein NUV52_04070 [Candidatus Roizmanbacteria bacterium]|nr:hypothetical protein [Candidatus Roizmanbacteria bacterium]